MTAGYAAGAALVMYGVARARGDEEAANAFGFGAIVSMIAAALSAGCVAYALRLHDFHPGEAGSVALAWALSGTVWRGAMGRWRYAIGAMTAALSLALAAHWYVERENIEWLLTAVLVASYLAVLDMLGLAYVIGLVALVRVHSPEAIATPGFFPGLLAACLPGGVTWLAMSAWRASRAREAVAPAEPVERREDVVPGISRYVRRVNFEFGFLAAAAIVVGVPFMTNQVYPMAGVETGDWLVLGLITLLAGTYNLVTRPRVGAMGGAETRALGAQLAIVALLSPILLGISFSRQGNVNGSVYLGLMMLAMVVGWVGVMKRPRDARVSPDDIRLLGLQLLVVFPMAYGWSWMIKGIRSDAQWWVAYLLPIVVWVARGREAKRHEASGAA